MDHAFNPISTLIRDLVGGDDGPPKKGNAAPAGNRGGAYGDGMGDTKNSSGNRKAVQAVIDELVGHSRPEDSPLDITFKITRFQDVHGFEKKTLTLSTRDLADEIEHWTAPEKARLPLIVGGEFGNERSEKGSLRHAANRRNVTAIVVDYDDEVISVDEAGRRVKEAGVAAFLYTSPSHTEDAPRWRAVFPLSRPVSTSELGQLTDRANGLFDGRLSGETWNTAQSYFAGQVEGCRPMRRALVDGRALDLADDLPRVPSKHGTTTRHRDKAEDPTTKRGEVGAWCRTFNIPAVIDEFLSHVYEPAGRGRYRFKAGSSKVGGVAVYDDGRFAYSNHDSDPARGLNNAFDLVRIHQFGKLDEGLPEGTPMTERPSYRAMCEFARRDPAVAEELAREEESILDEFDNIPDEPKKPSHLTFMTPDECGAAPQRGYVIKGIIAPRDVACIFGAPGAGKSLIAPYLGYRVAQGETAFGMRTKPGGVFYVAAEDETGMRGRVAALKDELDNAEDFTLVGGVSNLFSGSADFQALHSAVKERKPSLIVVDTLAMAFPGLEENSAESMGKVVTAARALTEHGAAVVLVHHSTKDSNGTPRGHSILNGALDVAVELQAKDDGGIIRGKLTKNRNGPCDVDIAFKIAVTTMGEDEDGDPITYARCEPVTGAPAKGPKPTPAERAALDVLRSLDNGALGIDEGDWRRGCQQDPALCASDDPESRRKAVYRAIQGLARKRLVTIRDGRVWAASRHSTTAEDFDEIDEPGDDWISRLV